MTQIVFLNGEFLAKDQAKISPFDRGFLFGDAVYEVIPVYQSKLFHFEQHLERLNHSLKAIYLDPPYDIQQWRDICQRLIAENGGGHFGLYLQVSRGDTQQRDNFFPKAIKPTVFAMLTSIEAPTFNEHPKGIKTVSLPDIRWSRCDIKSTSRLAFSLMQQQAEELGADTAIIIKDGYLSESVSSNVFVIKDRVIKTPPLSSLLLSGITRDILLNLAKQEAIKVLETNIHESELLTADEIWLTSSTMGIRPVSHYQNRPIGQGEAGPVWQHMAKAYIHYIHSFMQSEDESYVTTTS